MVSFGSQVDFSPPHIQIRALNKSYTSNGQTVQALKAIDLDIPQGKILGVIGKSGAGKSSLLRTLNGLETPSSGSIKIHQDELTTLDHAQLIHLRQKIGMIFQHFNLMSVKTVWDNVALPLKIAGLDKVEIQRRVDEVLGLVDLAHKAGQYPSQLSGGQKQRVGIARALVHHPEILLCDEATSALDPESTATVLSLLKKINRDLGITVVLITHEMQVIREICDQVVVIDQGEIVESGLVWSVFSNPKQKITQELLNLEQLNLPFTLYEAPQDHLTHRIIKVRYQTDLKHPPNLTDLLGLLGSHTFLYQSHVDTVQDHLIGTLILAIPKQAFDAQVLKQLSHFVFDVEVIGYAQPTS
ncbi:methionine ABC transporter ATP-binding protein [Acinetobacter soli]|uniref:methionine ABC transporter ATP-binding protein n=1 Tax=Acinetobacter soli TaxID=487316 RepID=UPI000CE495EE|nr:ATP-binding cassette domain-containing protein [Acinetobacter soli]PPB87465.1 methionine ABC transporter ATP-binding protein [Acinetobacter soli]WEI13845.1 ATP-binding cassette domain-containing protein [Acinetobacter soli]WEI15515.1 ATP-binding cassette domain-containing protein [Acinetobacter soli]